MISEDVMNPPFRYTICMVYLIGVIVIVALISLLFWVLILRSMASATPYVPISSKLFPVFEHELQLEDSSVFYDLGCGDGKVVAHIARNYPDVRCIGIEFSGIPYLVARIRTRSMPNVRIEHADFFTKDISDATHVYMYQFPILMPRLLEKFKKELQSGTKVLSCDFKLPEIIPRDVVKTGRPAGFGGTIYTYVF
jgi:SAM-dependent methyltransferase